MNEQNYFCIVEFSDLVINIREQFPMNVDKTMLIASELGLAHPLDKISKKPICMTSDFCITKYEGGLTYDIVRTIKPSDDLLNPRTIEKFEIERVYWEREGIDWGIVTDLEINKTMAKNIRTFRDAYSIDDIPEFLELTTEQLCLYKSELARGLVCADDISTRTEIHI